MAINILEDVQKRVIALYKANTWLNTNTNGLYFNKADETKAYPYCVFMLDADYDEYATGNSQMIRLQFNCFSDSDSTEQMNDIMYYLITTYYKANLGLTEKTLCTKPAIDTQAIFENDSDIIQGTLIFRFRTM